MTKTEQEELNILKEQNVSLKNAVALLIRRAKLKPNEAINFIDYFPEWDSAQLYHKGDYFTYGTDEHGNKNLWLVNAVEIRGKVPKEFGGEYCCINY